MTKTNEKNLCVVTGNLIVAKEVFTEGGAEKLLEPLRKALKEFVPDITTAKGRKEIASFSAKYSKSKTLVDGLGKSLKDEYSILIKPIDKERKIFRDECDAMKAEARKPLTLWEEEQERIAEQERLQVAFELDHEEAIGIDDLFNRERAMALKDAEYKRIEDERAAKEKADQAERDRLEYEAKVKADAEEKAKREAEEALLLQKQEQERWIIEAKEAQEQARIDAENAEKKRLADIIAENLRVEEARIEAAQRAEHEKAEAIAKVKREHEAKEQAEKERLETERLIADRKARHLGHQKAVNNKILAKILPFCSSKESAMKLISDVVKNPISEISINY